MHGQIVVESGQDMRFLMPELLVFFCRLAPHVVEDTMERSPDAQ